MIPMKLHTHVVPSRDNIQDQQEIKLDNKKGKRKDFKLNGLKNKNGCYIFSSLLKDI